MHKQLFEYLKSKGIKHEFNTRTSEILINRENMNYDLREFSINIGFNIFELDNLVIIF